MSTQQKKYTLRLTQCHNTIYKPGVLLLWLIVYEVLHTDNAVYLSCQAVDLLQ